MQFLATKSAILGLHHAQVTVPTAMEAAAREFYSEVLGLSEIEKPDELKDRGGTWYALGGMQLHLTAEDGVNRRSTKAHIAYAVNDLDYWRNQLLAHDVTPIETVPIPGYDRFEARDPFGNRIEFIQRIG